jgi:hypothetical protein
MILRFVFQWFPAFKEVYEIDKKPLTIGKKYKAEMDVFFCKSIDLVLHNSLISFETSYLGNTCSYRNGIMGYPLATAQGLMVHAVKWCKITTVIQPLPVTYIMNLTVKRFTRSSMVVLEGDSLIRPVIKIQAGWTDKGKSKLTIGVYYNRRSALFQVGC